MGLDILPIWGVFLATVALVLASVEVGFRVGRYRNAIGAAKEEGPTGGIVGATLALLAFLLTFSFGVAAARYETRRQFLLDEANAIGTTYLRAGMLPEPHRGEIQRLLRDYIETRIAGANPNQIAAAIAKSESLQAQLWSQADQVAALDSHSIVTGLFIQALNETIDLHATRIHALRARIPGVIWAIVGFVTALAMLAAGYQEGLGGSRRSPVILTLVLAFSGVVTLISDLDRPHEGFVRVSQQIMLDQQRSMQAPVK
jgi:hypothetical protein